AAAEALGGGAGAAESAPPGGVGTVLSVPSVERVHELAGRLALAYRCIQPIAPPVGPNPGSWIRRATKKDLRAAFRPVGSPSASPTVRVRELAAAWEAGGGRIDLRAPDRRFYFAEAPGGGLWLGEEIATVDRRARSARRMPKMPFQRPVSLPPQLGRVAANLARIRPGERIVDPFVGTGALLAEAALLGARVSGGDQEATMIRGAMINFEHLGVNAELLKVVDAGAPFSPPGGGWWDGIVTDPPYGRSSGTRGEPPEQLLPRALASWAAVVRPDGWLSLVAPSTAPTDVGPGWRWIATIADRVHRSLTREFRTYRRSSGSAVN
ncbi:MAG: hypothetical protein L3K08_02890, partial [Thermoplasmata archaeon]|nr:hypothetical protein [Thermoplasmata archaeon]